MNHLGSPRLLAAMVVHRVSNSRGPEREPDFFRTPEDICATGPMFLAERFHHLLDAEDDLGLMVVDSRSDLGHGLLE